jgi:sugar phosphate isomerase/epimerase
MWTLSGFADEIDPDPDVQFRTLNELGIRFVEFRSAWDTNVLDLEDDQVATIKQKLTTHGLRVSAVGSPIGKVGIHDDFDAHLVRFDRALWVAEQLETRYIRLFSFFVPEGDDPAAHRTEVLRRMSALAARSKGHDVVLCHENEKHIYGDTPARCLDLVESVGSERLRLVWDAANFVQCGVRPFTDGYALLRPHLEYVQIKDALFDTGEVVPAGKGDGEIDRTNRALEADGFDGFFSMEPHLAQAGASGGFSGPELFAKATGAFTALLDAAGIPYD